MCFALMHLVLMSTNIGMCSVAEIPVIVKLYTVYLLGKAVTKIIMNNKDVRTKKHKLSGAFSNKCFISIHVLTK